MALCVAIRGLESESTRTLVWHRSSSRVVLLELECDVTRARVSLRSHTRETATLH